LSSPIAENLFTWPSPDPQLIAGRHVETGKLVFPFPSGPQAGQFEPFGLSRHGVLWSYTVQRFPPKSPPYLGQSDPKRFKPFAIGYVELPGEIIVETRIETDALEALHIGQAMRLAIVAMVDAQPSEDAPLIYAFTPVGAPV